ncbi:DUF86 domain-containing protein [Parafilimonas sp.]|uniref:HepT-like ribonuclease domain-containing protein n=1 Tax=Parafilimonas sp. TaxID=1969739 RepID=UPI0039E29882
MSKRADILLVQDMIDAAEKIFVYTKGFSFEQFCTDSKTSDAVIRNFEIIGEAASRISESLKEKYPDIEWHKIRGFRNRIVHDYIDIDYEIVWQIKETYLIELLMQLRKIVTE